MSRTRKRRLLLAIGVATAVGAALAVALRKPPTARVDRGPIVERIVALGSVEPSAGVRRVHADRDGRIVRVFPHAGDAVEADQPLLEFEAGGELSTLRSPQRGVVVARACEVGDPLRMAERAAPLFELADATRTEVRIEVEEVDAARLAVGQAVSIQLRRPGGQRVRGRVARVAARLEARRIGASDARVRADGLVRVATVAFESVAPSWPLGSRVEASIEVLRREAALRVPRAAVAVRDGRAVVDRRSGPWTREVPIEIVASDDAYTEIRGLPLASEVIVHAQSTR